MEKTELPSKDAAQPSFLRREELLLLLVSIISMTLGGMSYSNKAPFYPSLSDEKGAPSASYGVVLCMVDLVVLLLGIPSGEKLFQIGTKYLSLIGLVLLGSANIAFSTVCYIDNTRAFIAASVFIRVVEGCGHLVLYAGNMCLVTTVFTHKEGTIMAMIEFSFNIGIILGPLLGGVLFDVEGFFLPYCVMGGMIILMIPLCCLFTPQLKPTVSEESYSNIFHFLMIPQIWLAVASIVVSIFNAALQNGNLEAYLRPFNISETAMGGIFGGYGLSASLSALMFGRLMDKGVPPVLCLLVGFSFQVLGMGLTGPLAWIPTKPKLELIVPGVMINGVGVLGVTVPAMMFIRKTIKRQVFELNVEVNGKISCIIQSSTSLGAVFGFSLGVTIVQNLGFRIGQFICISNAFVIAFMFIIFQILKATKRSE